LDACSSGAKLIVPRDPYDVLGVSRDASDGEIKKAYRRLAMEHHPDRNDGDKDAEEKFKEATEAYEVLRNPESRARFDRFGWSGVKGGAGFGGGFHPFDLSEALNVFMSDFGGLEGIFGGGGGRRSRRDRRRGQDVRISLRLSLEDVAKGTKRKVKLRTLEICEVCEGSGGKDGEDSIRCSTCGGSGEVRRATQSLLGNLISVTTCPTCHGEGKVIRNPCPECRGDGRTRVEKVVEIEVPPGVSESNYLTLRGQGSVGPRRGPPGDLIVGLEMKPDQRFHRNGDDLVYDELLSFSQAALGHEVSVPGPLGKVPVSIPPGTQSGAVITVHGEGIPSLNRGGRGDLHVRVQVWTPKRLNTEQEALFRQLAEIEGEPPEEEEGLGRKFWNRMKEALGG